MDDRGRANPAVRQSEPDSYASIALADAMAGHLVDLTEAEVLLAESHCGELSAQVPWLVPAGRMRALPGLGMREIGEWEKRLKRAGSVSSGRGRHQKQPLREPLQWTRHFAAHRTPRLPGPPRLPGTAAA